MKSLLFLLIVSTLSFSQQFSSLDGIEDNQDNSLLLYRLGEPGSLYNPVNKFNTQTLDESLIMQAYYSNYPGGTLAKSVNDFEYFPDDANNFMNVGFKINPDNHYQFHLPVSVENENSSTPFQFKLEQNYPNPFNPTTKIKFTIPQTDNPLMGGAGGGFVTLKVYDVLGTEITTLVNERKDGRKL